MMNCLTMPAYLERSAVRMILLCVAVFYLETVYAYNHKCSTCKNITEKFDEGLVRTKKSNFGGGNTNWEEKTLSSYAKSEIRFTEISETLCGDSDKECHAFLEEYEEALEHWWFKIFGKQGGDGTALKEYLCIGKASLCCADGHYGPSCMECPGGKVGFCSGNGACSGEGTRQGTGKCSCHDGYKGEMCDACTDGYFEKEKEKGGIECIKCDDSCANTCWEEGSKGCDECKTGYTQDEENGCVDNDECLAEQSPCKTNQYCTNNPGSYKCQACNSACSGCTGEGAASCVECADRYWDKEGTCTACHVSCEGGCTGATAADCNNCKPGWKFQEGAGCTDENECEAASSVCKEDQYCINNEGSYQCKDCHQSCDSCTGGGELECVHCKKGFTRKPDDIAKCTDIDECGETGAQTCPGEQEVCKNTPGSYKCVCKEGYVRQKNGECSKKPERPKIPPPPEPPKKAEKKKTQTRKKGKKKNLSNDYLKYIGSLFGFSVVGWMLKRSSFAQLIFTCTFWIYLFWFSSRFDKLKRADLQF